MRQPDRNLLKAFAVAAYLCTLCACNWAETLTLGAEDDWAPYSSNLNGEAKGFAVDLIRETFKAAGVDVKFVPLPYARCIAQVKAGALAGCFDTARDQRLEEDYLWHAKPMFNARINIYATADSKESGLTTKQLEGKRVAVTNGYEYGEAFDNNTLVKRDVANHDENGFSKLLLKRADYTLTYELVANNIFAKNQRFAGKFVAVGTVAAPDLYIAFSKTHPDGAKYLPKFNQGFDTILKNGRYTAITAHWK